jgi:hypothetical protein
MEITKSFDLNSIPDEDVIKIADYNGLYSETVLKLGIPYFIDNIDGSGYPNWKSEEVNNLLFDGITVVLYKMPLTSDLMNRLYTVYINKEKYLKNL